MVDATVRCKHTDYVAWASRHLRGDMRALCVLRYIPRWRRALRSAHGNACHGLASAAAVSSQIPPLTFALRMVQSCMKPCFGKCASSGRGGYLTGIWRMLSAHATGGAGASWWTAAGLTAGVRNMFVGSAGLVRVVPAVAKLSSVMPACMTSRALTADADALCLRGQSG